MQLLRSCPFFFDAASFRRFCFEPSYPCVQSIQSTPKAALTSSTRLPFPSLQSKHSLPKRPPADSAKINFLQVQPIQSP